MKQLYILSLIILLVASAESKAQYLLNGSATKNSCNCYTLTPASNTLSGSVWNATKISLNQPFDFWFNVYLGCKDDDGADGIVFILQTVATSVGATGEGLGFGGVSPSIGIALDTWQNNNLNDPWYDHISIQANGNITHGNDLAGPVQASATNTNIEDCQWHILRISWDPVTQLVSAYFDNSLRVQAQVDLVGTIFNNDPMVYWGFSAATGGSNNLQQFCTALTPEFTTSLGPTNSSCDLLPVSFQNTSFSFGPIQSYYWDFGDGTTSTLPDPPPKQYPQPGLYDMKLVITGLDGCISDTLKKTLIFGTKPVAAFDIFDTCAKKPIRLEENSSNSIGAVTGWSWYLNGGNVSGVQTPQFYNLSPGIHEIKLVAESIYGCVSDTVTKTLTIKNLPEINVGMSGACLNEPVSFQAFQTDFLTTINQWNWSFGDGDVSALQNPSHLYSTEGLFTVNTWVIDDEGCSSDTASSTLAITKATAFAGNDTIILQNVPFQLSGSGGVIYHWDPPAGLSNPDIANPVATLQDDMTYELTVETQEGCIAKDTIHLEVFKGSAIYVPTGFTPNSDGRNDLLKPRYIGIRKLYYFVIYNRWGQKVFETNNLQQGWDGRIGGKEMGTDSFVWMIKAEDYVGKMYELKGTTTLIR